jgi:L-2-hydroxyglutarate oxidase LhgO
MQGHPWLLIIFLAIMSSITCPGCKKSYAIGRSFQLHTKSCRHLTLATQDLFKKRQENIQQKTSGSKTARYEDLSSDDIISQRQNLRDEINSDLDLPHTTTFEPAVRFPLICQD